MRNLLIKIRNFIYRYIFSESDKYQCICYRCNIGRQTEIGPISYIHCYYCDRYFYKYQKFIKHFTEKNLIICPIPYSYNKKI